jgi:Fur family transcriptional regulator, ferric uptake regulator
MTEAPERKALAFDEIQEVIDALRRAGHRLSTPARVVLQALFAADGPVSAERVAGGLGGRFMPLELTSVYRNLERLQHLGVVTHVHMPHGPGLYALTRGGDREYLVCERCGEVTSVDPARLDGVREQVHDAFGYHVRFSHFPLHGFCAACAASLGSGQSRPPARIPKGIAVPHVEHDHVHSHEHRHGDVVHSHPHTAHDHRHVEHEHEHSHGDLVHSHPHPHEAGLEHEHGHEHT